MSAFNSIFSRLSEPAENAYQLTTSSIKNHLQITFDGLTAVNVAGRIYGCNPKMHGLFMNFTLAGFGFAKCASGLAELAGGIQQKSFSKIVSGTVSALAGVATSVLASHIDSRNIAVAHQAIASGLISSFIGVHGLKEIEKGNTRSGLCKIALGIAGIAGSALYAYHSYIFFSTKPLPSEHQLFPFLESHKSEIEEMYQTRRQVGQWEKLGQGMSKLTFTHIDSPEWVIKVPAQGNNENIMKHHLNLEYSRSFADKFDRIILPESYLYSTAKGDVLVEEILEIQPYLFKQDQREAFVQLNELLKITGLCDIAPAMAHNAGIVVGTIPPKMGIIDFDCISPY